MSAIFGAIDLKHGDINKDLCERFLSSYEKYKIDRMECVLDKNLFMACGIQYFNKEAEREQLPYHDAKHNLFYTADCVIDNREDLIEQLGLQKDCPDGEILLNAYHIWNKDCMKYLRGTFSFVIYDILANKVFLAVDHFAQRCLMYYVRDGVLYFSTLLFPMLESVDGGFRTNDRWLIDSVSLRSPAMVTEPKETAVMDVYKVVSGTYVEIQLDENTDEVLSNETRYFDPFNNIKTDWSISLEESERLIKETMSKSVSMILRDGIKVASQLSSGLDSSTVACIAAGQLGIRNKKLYTYTSIPLAEANLPEKGYKVYNERKGVEIICKAYQNIEPTFVDSKGRSFLKEVDNILNKWEMPCKSQQNAIWTDEISKQAAANGCKILLSGATGNTTLSAGSICDSAVYYGKHLRPIKALKMLDPLKNNKRSRKACIKGIVSSIAEYYKWYFDKDAKDVYKYIVTRKDIGEKYSLTKRFQKISMHFYPYTNMKKMREYMYILEANAQIGELETGDSLTYGIISRDPIRNVEVVEMCMRLPMECYSSTDYDRRLVRVGMKGIVPKEIREDVMHRGAQSGDNLYRANLEWKKMKSQIESSVCSPLAQKYLDKEKVNKLFKSIECDLTDADYLDALLISDLYSFSRYIQLLDNKKVVS